MIWDVMIKMLYRDNYPDLVQAAMAERDRQKMEVIAHIGKLIRAFPKHKLNTRARRLSRTARRL